MTDSVDQRHRIAGATHAAVLWVVALGMRLFGLGRQSLWIDELSHVTWAKGHEYDHVFDVLASETGVRLQPSSLDQALAVVSRHGPPLNDAVLNLWMRLFGDSSDFATRLPGALSSAACAPVTYAAFRSRFGDTAAFAAGGLVALSPFHVLYAQEVNYYGIASFCVAVSVYFYVRYTEAPRAGIGVLWALASAAAMYAHYYAAIVLSFQCFALLASRWRSFRGVVQALWPGALAITLFAPYVPVVFTQLPELTSTAQTGTFQGAGYFFERVRAMLVMPLVGELGNYSGWLEVTPVIVVTATLWSLGILRARRPDRTLLAVNLFGPLVFIAVAYFVRRQNSILWPRYQLFFTFPSYACIGVALAALSGRLRWLRWFGAVSLCGLLVAGNVYQQHIVREDWRTAAALVDAPGARDEPVLVYRQNLVYSVARYLRGNSHLFGIGPALHLEQTLGVIVGADQAARGIWYASAWPVSNEMADRVHTFLRARYERCEPAPVNPGLVDLHLLHCVIRRSATVALPPWWRPREGPVREGGWLDIRDATGVGGWAFSSRGIPTIRVSLDGKTIAEVPHPGAGRADVAHVFSAYPPDLTEPSGFFVPVQLDQDAIVRVTVSAVRADGSSFVLPSSTK